MVPRMGAAYVGKIVKDQLFAPPKEDETLQEAAESPQASPGGPVAGAGGDLDGQVILDDEGTPLGPARYLAGVSLYVVSRKSGEREETLRASLDDPDTRVFLHAENGRLAALIYVPDPDKAAGGIQGTRSDDV